MNTRSSIPSESGSITSHRRCALFHRLLPVLLLGLLATSLHALQSGDFTYSGYPDAVIITGYTGPGGAVTIPETIEGLPVLSFGLTFSRNTTITSVTIPNTVKSINSESFLNCTGLTSVTIPSSITSIGNSAFYNCTGLTDVSIPFGVTSIYGYAFYGCTGLTNVMLPSSITIIDTQVFYECSNLGNISVEASSTTYSAAGGVLFNKEETTLIQYPGGKIGAYTIPSAVTSIDSYAFASCAGLTSVIIPHGVTSIAQNTFRSCTGLTSVTIPSSVTTIDNYAFYDCTDLTTVTVPSSVTNIGDNVFHYCASLTSVMISSGVTRIGSYAFRYCSGLTSVTIPASVTNIGFYAFAECSNLTSITVPSSNSTYSTIGGVLFNKIQTNLIQYPGGKTGAYTIPSGVQTIDIAAFRSCTGLTSVTIPASVTSIGASAFTGCSNLASFSVSTSSAVYSTTGGVLLNKAKTALILYPGGRIGGYTIPSGITSIGTSAFASCAGLSSVTISSGVTIIGNNSFNSCTSLTSVTISSTVTRIGSDSFANCTGLTSVTIPSSVTSIGSFAFSNCTRLTAATFSGNAPTSFGAAVFGYTASDFTIRFYAGSTGFTTPTWLDYSAVVLPTNPSITGFVRNSNGSATLKWWAPKGVTNPSLLTDVVYRSSNLVGWSAIALPLSIDADMVVFTDPSPLQGNCFYRVGRPVSP